MILIANKTGEIDSAYHTLVQHIKSSVPIVMVSWSEKFVFNEALLELKEWIYVGFEEYGWDFDLSKTGSHIWGQNSEKFPRYYHGDWIKFDDWVKENPPRLILKRELLKRDVSGKVKPIEYPCVVSKWMVDTKERFDQRPINVFQYWGRSSEHRLRIHADIWHHATKKGFSVCDNLYYIQNFLNEERGEKWVTMNIPHYQRVDINSLLTVNAISKLSLSWGGAGFRCFRTAEAPVNSVMVMHKNEMAWSFDWNESNCILVEQGKEMEGIDRALNDPNLYEIYKAGVGNCDKYRLENYIPYLESLINNA